MVGPGLFFALALLIAGAARAETSVGLDARGVDPLAAVHNPQGLDVRDELGRPVSAQAVLSDLKKAQAARAEQTAYASTLPKAKVVLPLLETATARALALLGLVPAAASPAVWASLPAPRPKLSALVFALLGAVLSLTAAPLRPRTLRPALSSCRRCLEVLLC